MRKLGILVFTAMVVASPATAKAQEISPEAQAIARPGNDGVMIEDGQSFTLRIHGAWPAPERILEALDEGSGKIPTLRPARVMNKKPASGASHLRRQSYLPWVSAAELRYAIPAGLLDAVIWVETRYNPFAVSPKGAGGLGQLMAPTATSVGVRNRFDPYENIEGAARYLRQMLDRFGVVQLAVAAYNAGPGAVARSKGIPANGETPSYVSQVLTRWSLSGT